MIRIPCTCSFSSVTACIYTKLDSTKESGLTIEIWSSDDVLI